MQSEQKQETREKKKTVKKKFILSVRRWERIFMMLKNFAFFVFRFVPLRWSKEKNKRSPLQLWTLFVLYFVALDYESTPFPPECIFSFSSNIDLSRQRGGNGHDCRLSKCGEIQSFPHSTAFLKNFFSFWRTNSSIFISFRLQSDERRLKILLTKQICFILEKCLVFAEVSDTLQTH